MRALTMNVRTWTVRTAVVAVSAATVFVAGCDEKLQDVTGPSPNLVPTFSSIQQEIFLTTDLAGRTSCITCHTNVGRNPAGNLNMAGDAYASLVGVPSRERTDLLIVAPGDPEASYLIHKLEGRPGIVGLQMPRNGPPFLTSGQLLVIKRWIELGAPR
jgi:hypothetical protein